MWLFLRVDLHPDDGACLRPFILMGLPITSSALLSRKLDCVIISYDALAFSSQAIHMINNRLSEFLRGNLLQVCQIMSMEMWSLLISTPNEVPLLWCVLNCNRMIFRRVLFALPRK